MSKPSRDCKEVCRSLSQNWAQDADILLDIQALLKCPRCCIFHIIDPCFCWYWFIYLRRCKLVLREMEGDQIRIVFFWAFGIEHVESAALIALQLLLPFKLKTNKKGCQRANGKDLDQLIDIFIQKRVSNQTGFRLRKTWEGNHQY